MRPLRYFSVLGILLILPLSFEGFGQQIDVDSLLIVRKEQSGADLAFTNLLIAKYFSSIDQDSADYFIQKAEEYNALNYRKDLAAKILQIKGRIAEFNNEYQLSMEMLRRAYGLYKEIGNYKEMGWTSRGIGATFFELGNYENATEYFILGLSAFEQDENKRGVAEIYNLLGAVYYVTGHENKALEYYNSSIELFEEIGGNLMKSKVQNNIGILFIEEEKYADAIKYFNDALTGFHISGNEKAICAAYSNLAICYSDLEMFDSALEYIHRSRILAVKIGSTPGLIKSYVNLGSIHIGMMELDSARHYLLNGLSMAKKNNLKPVVEEAYLELSNLYSAEKSFEVALAYRLKYAELHDEIHEKNSEIRIQNLMSSYEQTLKQNEIEQLTADQEAQSLINKVFAALIALTLILLLIMVAAYTNNKKKNKLLEEKNNELQNSNQKLLHSEENMKKVIDDKDRLFTIIAHDLRNPVAAVSGFSELLYVNYDKLDSGTRMEYVSQIVQGSTHTYELLENLLLWARSQMDSISINKTDTNIHKLIDDSIISVQSSIQRKEINISLSVDCDFSVYADYDMIKAVIRNLITNAVKFSYPGGDVEIRCSIAENRYHIAIVDHGIGMGAELVKELFTEKIGTTTPGTAGESGSGLGLMISKDYTERNGGTIHVESMPGKGSTFSISLPFKTETT